MICKCQEKYYSRRHQHSHAEYEYIWGSQTRSINQTRRKYYRALKLIGNSKITSQNGFRSFHATIIVPNRKSRRWKRAMCTLYSSIWRIKKGHQNVLYSMYDIYIYAMLRAVDAVVFNLALFSFYFIFAFPFCLRLLIRHSRINSLVTLPARCPWLCLCARVFVCRDAMLWYIIL